MLGLAVLKQGSPELCLMITVCTAPHNSRLRHLFQHFCLHCSCRKGEKGLLFLSLLEEKVFFGRIVLARDVTSECISGGTKFAAVGTGVTLGDGVFAFDVLVKDSFVFGGVRASKTAPESHPFHLLPRHLCFNLTWWQLKDLYSEQIKSRTTWLRLGRSLVCDGD